MHLVLQLCVVMAFSSSSRPADFFSFFTRLLTAFSLHLSSLSAFFQPSNRLTIGGLKLGNIEVIICPETSARDPHRAAPTGLSSLSAYKLYQRAIAVARPGGTRRLTDLAAVRAPNTDRDSRPVPPDKRKMISLSRRRQKFCSNRHIVLWAWARTQLGDLCATTKRED